MNISRQEQRALHVLALGGRIVQQRAADDLPDRAPSSLARPGSAACPCKALAKGGRAKVIAVTCITRDGMILADFTLETFQRLRRRGLIESHAGSAYRLSRRGRLAVRAQLDNRGS